MHENVKSPDRVPDRLIAAYERDAARAVRRSRRRSRRRRLWAVVKTSDTWWTTLMIFFLLTLGVASVGGAVYAAIMWPRLVLLIAAPTLVLGGVSLTIAVLTRDRWRRWTD